MCFYNDKLVCLNCDRQ